MTQHVRKGREALQGRRERALAACVARVEKYQALLVEPTEEDATLDELAVGYVPSDLVRAISLAEQDIVNLGDKGVKA